MKTQHHFDERATTWTSRYENKESFKARLVTVGEVILQQLRPMKDPRVLDYGCGTGVFGALASSEAAAVFCLDVNETMLQSARSDRSRVSGVLARSGYSVRPNRMHELVGTPECLSASDGRGFDLIIAVAVIEYVPDVHDTLRILAALLNSHGIIVMTVPNPNSVLRASRRLLGPLLGTATRVFKSERLADQTYANIRPFGDSPPWRRAANLARLEVAEIRSVPLRSTGLLSHTRPTHVVSLRQRPRVGQSQEGER